MKTKKYLLLYSLILLISSLAYSQWETEIRLTNDPFTSLTSFNNAWCVASIDSMVHVVWQDSRDGPNYEIYYKWSTDCGASWGTDIRLTNDPSVSACPSVAVSDSIVHVVWQDAHDFYLEIYYKHSTDRGITWEPDIKLTNVMGAQHASMAVSGSFVHVVWTDYRNGNYDIYYKRSTDGGRTWITDTRLTDNTNQANYPSIAVSDSIVHVAWFDSRDGNFEIYYKRSTDNGETWEEYKRLTNNSSVSWYPTIAASDSIVHVAWRDNLEGFDKILYRRSTDNGLSWEQEVLLTSNDHNAYYPSLAASGSIVHVVWQDDREGFWKTFYKRSTNGGISWETDTKLTSSAMAYSLKPSVAVSNSVVHVVWQDNRDGGDYEIYYKRNLTGNITDIKEVNQGISHGYQLNQNYPNPFNSLTNIPFITEKFGYTRLCVYDILGRELMTIVSKMLPAGRYTYQWNPMNLPSGVYFYRLQSGSFIDTKKLLLIR